MTDPRDPEQENKELRETLLNAYETIESLGSISDCFDAITGESPRQQIIALTDEQLRKIFPFQTTAFFLFPEKEGALECARCSPFQDQEKMEAFIMDETEKGNLHIALRDQRPMLRHIEDDRNDRLLIHSLGTSRRSRGIFAGMYHTGVRTSDTLSELLITLVLSQCSNALESTDLYEEMQRSRRLLTGNKEQSRINFQKLNNGMDRIFSLFQRLNSETTPPGSMENNTRIAVMRWVYYTFTRTGVPEVIALGDFLSELAENYALTFGLKKGAVRIYGPHNGSRISLDQAVPLSIALYEFLALIFHRSQSNPVSPIDLNTENGREGWEVRIKEQCLSALPFILSGDSELFHHIILNELGGRILTPGDGSLKISGFQVPYKNS